MVMPLQDIISRVKRELGDRSDFDFETPIEYHIYDIITDDTFEKRLDTLTSLFCKGSDIINYPIKIVTTGEANSIEEIKEMYWPNLVGRLKYEGLMLRNPNGLYVPKHRSYDLQKFKEMVDKEFLIIGAEEAEGRDAGIVIWIVQNLENKEIVFSVRPTGTHEQRSYWWKNKESFIGKLITVQFQDYSKKGVPIFPVGISIRDYE